MALAERVGLGREQDEVGAAGRDLVQRRRSGSARRRVGEDVAHAEAASTDEP